MHKDLNLFDEERNMPDKEIYLKDEVYAIIGAAIEVHKELGPGFLEAVYHEALEMEETAGNIPFRSKQLLPIYYKGQLLQKHYEADQVGYEQIVVEIKALDRLTNREIAQLLNYLKATRLKVGLLINFGSKGKLEWQRYVV